jgi:hypothetical protein
MLKFAQHEPRTQLASLLLRKRRRRTFFQNTSKCIFDLKKCVTVVVAFRYFSEKRDGPPKIFPKDFFQCQSFAASSVPGY